MMMDKNGKEMRTGDIVKISGAYTQRHNGYFVIEHTPGDASWLGDDYCLQRLKKNGEYSQGSYTTQFWPLSYYSNNTMHNALAQEHDSKNATIEVVGNVNTNFIILHFEEEIEKALKSAKRDAWNFGEDSEIVKKEVARAEHYKKVVEYIKNKEKITEEKEEIKEKETTETTCVKEEMQEISEELKRVWLQGIGYKKAVFASELKSGMTIIWNYGYKSTIKSITPTTSGKSYKCVLVNQKGQEKNRTMRATTLFAVDDAPIEEKETTICESEPPKKELNSMCLNCACLGVDCNGTCETVWTGCIYKKAKAETEQQQEETAEQPKIAQEATEELQAEILPNEEKMQETTQKPLVKYYTINEQTARTAKHLNSFSDYKDSEATTIYRQYVDNAAELAKRQIEKYPEEEEKILYYLDKYAKKLANWYNDYYRNESDCPSILISGGGNFPTRKKEKQNSRRDTLHRERQYIDGLLDKIKGIGTAGIKAGDANAIEKLEKKIAKIEADHKRKMAINNYYKKNGTLEGCELMSPEEIKKTMDFITRNPFFPPCITCNDTQNIRRYKERLESLKAAKTADTSEEENKYCKIVRNTEIMRIQLLFDGKPDEKTRNILKSNGFRWAPSQSAWQRNLNSNGEYAVKRVLQELDKMTA